MEEEETEKLVESFYNYLKQEKGLSEETASAHAHHIRFFALHYLIGYAEKNLLEVTDRDIDDYLGNWYIRKVWGGGKREVRPILTAFKKLLYGVFDGRIVPALKLFGLLDFGYEKDRKEYLVNRGLGIEWFAITKRGKKIFTALLFLSQQTEVLSVFSR
jgi:hypothetical protein